MIALGTTVLYRGRPALVVARTMAGSPTYDLRQEDGTVVKYVPESDFDAPEGQNRPPSPTSH